MRKQLPLVVVVLLLTVVTLLLIVRREPADQAGPSTSGASPAAARISDSGSTRSGTAAAGTPAVPARRPSNVPMKELGPGEKWTDFLAAAQQSNSRFNGFLTGLYLLTDENKTSTSGPAIPRENRRWDSAAPGPKWPP